MNVPSISDMRNSAADTAEECPGCGWEPEGKHITHTESHEEDYFSARCHDCQTWQYGHHDKKWLKLTAPGEENPTVQK